MQNTPAPSPARLSQRPTTTRRSLLTAAAWSAPVIAVAVAAPLAAASTLCVDPDVGINWGLATVTGSAAVAGRSTVLTRRAVFRPQNSTRPTTTEVTASVRHTFNGNMLAETNNGTVSAQNVGGIGQRGYQINQFNGADALTQPTANDFQTVVFAFDEELHNVRFSITDIDGLWQQGTWSRRDPRWRDFVDGVVLESTSPWESSVPAGSTVTGAGTATSPWFNAVDGNKDEDATGGQVDVVFPGPVRSFTVRYFNLGFARRQSPNDVNTDNDQTIFVTGMRVERRAAC